jgi:polysaccharide pyruvyl transferase CsaB
MAQRRAVLCGYYGKGNGGDEALLATLLQMLPSSLTPIVLSGNPAYTHKSYGVQACDRDSPWQVVAALQEAEVLIWGGGSLMQDVTSVKSAFYYGGMMGLAQQMGKKTIAWGQGIGPLNRQITRSLARRVFSQCDAVSVRDRASAALLSEWQIPSRLAPDPVWALESQPVPGLWDLPAPRVAVTLRQHPQLTPERIAAITRALIDFQTATQSFILLVPFQKSKDLAIAESIHRAMPKSSQIFCLENPQQLKGLFRGTEMAIGMRFHSLIMAAAEECRCFALSYDPKIDQLMADLDIPGWQIADLPEDPNLISQTWIECYANGDPLSPVQIQSFVDRALIHQDLLKEALEG